MLVPAERWRDLLKAWITYGALLVPLLFFSQRHPGALTTRFRDLTYLTSDKSFLACVNEFVHRYLADINPWRWLVAGGTESPAVHVFMDMARRLAG